VFYVDVSGVVNLMINRNKLPFKTAILCLGLLTSFCIIPYVSAVPQSQATIIFTANFPVIGAEDGYPKLASLIEQYRTGKQPVFFLFGGASIAPSPLSAFDRGAHIIDLLNSLEIDAMAVAKREFSYFEDELSLRAFEAAFPIISSNLYDPVTKDNMDGLVSSAIIQKGSIRIGVLAILDTSVMEEYLLKRVKVLPPQQEVIKKAEMLRQQGVDIVVLLNSDPFDFINKLLTEGVIDLSLAFDANADYYPDPDLYRHPRNLLIAKQGKVLAVNLDWQSGDLLVDTQLIALSQYPDDQEMQQQVDGYTKQLTRLLSEKIGVLETPLDTTRPEVRKQENAFANFVADTLREYSQADVALINSGLIRGEKTYEIQQVLTRLDIATELPFRTRINIVDVSGQQILDALENSFSMVEQLKGRFPQISGMKVEYNSSSEPGSRVVSISIANTKIDLQARYKLATTDYLADGGDGYTMFNQDKSSAFTKTIRPLVSDIVIDSIRSKHSISPRIDARIVDVGKPGTNNL
jgi:5'-nucleotidase / UDP-sugar diphosphatase